MLTAELLCPTHPSHYC